MMAIVSKIFCALFYQAIALAVFLSSSMGAPTSRANQPIGPGFWNVIPAPVPNNPPNGNANNSDTYASTMGNALYMIGGYLETFSTAAFGESFDQHCQTNPEYPEGYDWLLPSYIPKKIGESLESSHYSTLEYGTMLAHSSEVLQRFGVAWEQVADLDSNQSFQKEYTKTKNDLRVVFEFLAIALVEKEMSPAPDPTRSIMPNELKYLSGSAQNTRNFYILKYYINAFEYYIAVFNYFSKQQNVK